jgi:hypothetical protein
MLDSFLYWSGVVLIVVFAVFSVVRMMVEPSLVSFVWVAAAAAMVWYLRKYGRRGRF